MAVLTVSRAFGSGAEEIGRKVADRMGYLYVDKEMILQDMRTAGEKWERLGQELDEAAPSLWERFDWGYRAFVSLMESRIYDYAVRDGVVIMGRGAVFLLADIPYVLRVRVIAPLERRIDRVMMREHVDMQTAEWLIKKVDKDRDAYCYINYHRRLADAENYDMVFDTSVTSIEAIVTAITTALVERDGLASEEARKETAERALSARIKAAIATDSRFLVPTLEVFHDGEAVVLRGIVRRAEESCLIEEAARPLAGSTPVKNELHPRTAK